MPNLTLKISGALINERPLTGKLLDTVATELSSALGVPPKTCNVIAIEMIGSQLTAPIYAELVFRASDARPPTAIKDLAGRLAAVLQRHFKADIAFRGFPMNPESIVASDHVYFPKTDG